MGLSYSPAMVVILGAGASRGCLPLSGTAKPEVSLGGEWPTLATDDALPPVTQDLAETGILTNWVLHRWHWAAPVIDHLRRTLKKESARDARGRVLSLEQALRHYADGESGAQGGVGVPERRRHLLAAAFYLRDLLWATTLYMRSPDLTGGPTNHLTLLGRTMEWAGREHGRQVVFISFNYDLILEWAMASTWNFEANNLDSYLKHDRVKLLKPHGSVQWHWPLKDHAGKFSARDLVEFGKYSIGEALSHQVDRTTIESLNLSDDSSVRGGYRPLIPALAMPMDGKAEYDFVWPHEQAAHLQSLHGTVTKVLCIGWRALEPHFLPLLTPLVKDSARVLVVAGGKGGADEADATAHRLRPHLSVPPAGYQTFGGGFEKVVTSDCADLNWLFEG